MQQPDEKQPADRASPAEDMTGGGLPPAWRRLFKPPAPPPAETQVLGFFLEVMPEEGVPFTVIVTISDCGSGMDADFIRTRLLQPFASTKKGGFGVGAFEAKSLISAMGGRLIVESKPDAGSSFTIVLPAAKPAAEPQRKIA